MNRSSIIALIGIFMGSLQGQGTVKFFVQSDEGPLIGASIYNTETESGTITDSGGNAALAAKEGQQLLIRYLGYMDYNLMVGSEREYQILMIREAAGLDEIVVTALGLKRETRALGYAVQNLRDEEINEVKSTNFIDNLAGKVAGIQIQSGANGVGSTSRITIRGESSFTNNNPLFVLDGVPIQNRTDLNFTNEAAAGFQEIDFGNGGMEINADDVEEVTVLKGPGAAALYGTRASNGVIVVTTKDGSKSSGTGISFKSSLFVERPFQLPQFQNTYGQGNSGQFTFVDGLGGGINDNITYSYGPRLDAGLTIPQYDSPVTMPDGSVVRGGDVAVHGGRPITPTPFIAHPDNLKHFYELGRTYINNLSFAGSSEKSSYRLSLTDMNSRSFIPGVNLKRQTISVRNRFAPMDKLEIQTGLNYIRSASDNRPASGYGSENINYSLVAWLGRQTDLNPLKDYWQPGLENLQQYSYNYTFFDNPYFILLENQNAFERDRVIGYASATYRFNEHFSAMVRTGMDASGEDRTFKRAYSSNRFKNGAYAQHDLGFLEQNHDFLLNYSESYGDFTVDVSLGGNRMDQSSHTRQTQAIGLAQPGIYNLSNAGSPLEVFQYDFRKRINSFYGLAKVGFQNALYFDLTGRNDWSSALATPTSVANTSFFYPSISTGLILSNIFSLPEQVSFAKFRASWAEVGNDTDPYQTVGVFTAGTPYTSLPSFSDQSFIANADLLPERSTSIEVGMDLRFLRDRISIDAAYYQALNENQILSLPIPISSGYANRVVNGGSVQSRGVEVVAGFQPIKSRRLNWMTRLNFHKNVSTVKSLPESAGRLTLAYSRVYDNVNQTVWFLVSEGDRIGDIWGTGYARNEDGEFLIGEDGRLIVDNTLKKLGNYNPDFTLGWSNEIGYGNFALSFLVDIRKGGELVSRTLALAGVAGQLDETEYRPEEGLVFPGVINTGTEVNPVYVPNTIAISPESYYRQYYDRNHEENNTLDASFAKLRQMSISYTLEGDLIQKSFLSRLESVRIALIGRNLFALSKIRHFDPEQLAIQGNQFISGVEDMSYPTARSFGLSLDVRF